MLRFLKISRVPPASKVQNKHPLHISYVPIILRAITRRRILVSSDNSCRFMQFNGIWPKPTAILCILIVENNNLLDLYKLSWKIISSSSKASRFKRSNIYISKNKKKKMVFANSPYHYYLHVPKHSEMPSLTYVSEDGKPVPVQAVHVPAPSQTQEENRHGVSKENVDREAEEFIRM